LQLRWCLLLHICNCLKSLKKIELLCLWFGFLWSFCWKRMLMTLPLLTLMRYEFVCEFLIRHKYRTISVAIWDRIVWRISFDAEICSIKQLLVFGRHSPIWLVRNYKRTSLLAVSTLTTTRVEDSQYNNSKV
jgi:hypothetical protein